VSKGKLVILLRRLILGVLVRIIMFTKLPVSRGNYFGTVINLCFNELVSSNFLEFISGSFKPIMVCSN